jgi:addiction module RelE/StbE family toxin
MKIVWTQPAVEDLHELHAYIARDSELYASGFVEQLLSAVEALENHPKLGRIVPEGNDESIRELLSQHYRLIYRVAKDHIEMLSVIHGSRDLGTRESRPWEVG